MRVKYPLTSDIKTKNSFDQVLFGKLTLYNMATKKGYFLKKKKHKNTIFYFLLLRTPANKNEHYFLGKVLYYLLNNLVLMKTQIFWFNEQK